ncbi:hypothetical protein [Marinobacterium sedimentorum]|nr:hypothetical protein [Marinobacterium sedimentorum]MCP8687194.1 hypothetical protein [Marinobacterium sedimentorum]
MQIDLHQRINQAIDLLPVLVDGKQIGFEGTVWFFIGVSPSLYQTQ